MAYDSTYYQVGILNTYIKITLYGELEGVTYMVEDYLFPANSYVFPTFDENNNFGLQLIAPAYGRSFLFSSDGISAGIFIDDTTMVVFTYETLKDYLTAATSGL